MVLVPTLRRLSLCIASTTSINRRILSISRSLSSLPSLTSSNMPPTPWKPNQYPPTRRSDHVDVYKSEAKGEVRVPDPYNWLESDTEETDQWTTVQADFARKYLDQNSNRDKLEKEIRNNSDYAKVCTYMQSWLFYDSIIPESSSLHRA